MDKPFLKKLKKNEDHRGWVIEVLRGDWLPANMNKFGQIYISKGNKGKIKGEHYHKRKWEWFLVAQGKALFKWKNIQSGESDEFILEEAEPQLLKVPPGIIHSFLGKSDFLLFAYVSETYDQNDPDTYSHSLFKGSR